MRWFAGIWILGCALPLWGEEIVLRNKAIELRVDHGTGAVAVRDLRSSLDWISRADKGWRVKEAKKTGASEIELALEIEGLSFRAGYQLDAEIARIDLTLSAEPGVGFKRLDYPPCFEPSGKGWSLVLPTSEGLMLPLDAGQLPDVGFDPKGVYEPYSPPGLSMPWWGITNGKDGMMMILETEVDAGMELKREHDQFVPRPFWLPSKQQFSYPRKLSMTFFSAGGYVAMAKEYRQHLVHQKKLIALREKAAKEPDVEKLKGALNLWSQGPDHHKVLEGVATDLGVSRLLFQIEGHNADKAYHYPKKKELIARVKESGGLIGRYIFCGEFLPKEDYDRYLKDRFPEPWYCGDVATEGLKDAQGRAVPGFRFPKQRGRDGIVDLSDTISTFRRCPLLWNLEMERNLPGILKEEPYSSIFIDVVGTQPIAECYDLKHPQTRSEVVETRLKHLRFAREQGVVLGTENGAGWCIPEVHYIEGNGTIARSALIEGVRVGTKTFATTPRYEAINLGERFRVPLFQLVHHDAVVTTFRWNYTPDRYENPKMWAKHDLFVILYGYMPIFVMTEEVLKERGARMAETWRKTSPWHEKIAFDEMIGHKALTEDRTVQESRFSSGWMVVVNFGAKEFKLASGKTVSPMSFMTETWK